MRATLRRFWLQLTIDRRRFGVLCGVVGCALLLWARLLIISDMPRTAIAEPEEAPAAAPAQELPVRSDKPLRPVRAALRSIPSRDPFRTDDRFFPRPTPVSDLPADLGKSSAERAENPREVEARVRARLRDLVDRFSLDAVMSSGGMAVIDGRNYRVGDPVPSQGSEQIVFTLAEVRQRSIVLLYEGRRFELKMTDPGR